MAAALVTGRSWCLYTTSVVRVLEWPTASALFETTAEVCAGPAAAFDHARR